MLRVLGKDIPDYGSMPGFKEGRQFRAHIPIDLTTGVKVIKIEAAVDFDLLYQMLQGISGTVEMKAYRPEDVTDNGGFVVTPYMLPNNSKSTAKPYTQQVIYKTGGSVTVNNPLNYKDHLHVIVGNGSGRQTTISNSDIPSRGLPVNTYYLVFTGDGKGIFYTLTQEG